MTTSYGRPASLLGVKVLVAEDEAIVVLSLERLLQNLGAITLGPATSVAEALALLRKQRPDAAVLDLSLKDGRSSPVAEVLATMGVPFALLTGGARAELADPSLSGMPYLAKPYLPEELERLLLMLVGGSPSRAAVSQEEYVGHGSTRR
jgi:CheY-like chemotaxis protein